MTDAGESTVTRPAGWLAGRAIAVLGHELRNPLAAVAAGVGAVAAMTDGDDPRTPFLSRALTDLERLSVLLGAYLDLAAGRLPTTQVVDLAAVVRAVVGRRRGTRVTCRSDGQAMVSGCAALLERAMENLIDNALQAGAAHVEVRVACRAGTLTVVVDDDGDGVPEAMQSHLFEPFVTARRDGSGLGLALVAAIAEAHGGRVRLHPRACGARFVMTLPATASAAVPAASATC